MVDCRICAHCKYKPDGKMNDKMSEYYCKKQKSQLHDSVVNVGDCFRYKINDNLFNKIVDIYMKILNKEQKI